jgi:hypothetical protein
MSTSNILLSSILVAAFALAACGGSGETTTDPTQPGPLMMPGDNCLRCHNPISDTGAPPWSAGGTVFPATDAKTTDGVMGAVVEITDAQGKVVKLTTNEAGNFYTAEALEAPLRVALTHDGKRIEMPVDAPAGSCNACHSLPPVGGAPGRIHLP